MQREANATLYGCKNGGRNGWGIQSKKDFILLRIRTLPRGDSETIDQSV
jgi:hypothetical protein